MPTIDWSLLWLNRTLHIVACAACLLLLAAGAATGRWLSTFAEDNQSRGDAAAACLVQEAEISQRNNRLRAELDTAKGKFAALNACLPAGPREAELIAQLADIGKASGLEINSFRPGHKTEHADLGQLELRLSATGPFSGLCRFLSELPTLPRLCHVGGLEISPLDEAGATIAAELQLHVLFRSQLAPPQPHLEVAYAQ